MLMKPVETGCQGGEIANSVYILLLLLGGFFFLSFLDLVLGGGQTLFPF